MEISAVILKLVATFSLSLLFCLERQRSHKPIGFGKFIFVSVGACGLAITSISLDIANPLPLLSATVTGIGFLGAGALVKTKDKAFGFTTAASIWVFAIFGLVIGTGEYLIGTISYAIVWIVVFFDKFLEKKGNGSYQKKLIISVNRIIDEKEIKSQLSIAIKKHKMIGMEMDKKNNRFSITYLIEGTEEDINKIYKKLFEMEWFESCKIE